MDLRIILGIPGFILVAFAFFSGAIGTRRWMKRRFWCSSHFTNADYTQKKPSETIKIGKTETLYLTVVSKTLASIEIFNVRPQRKDWIFKEGDGPDFLYTWRDDCLPFVEITNIKVSRGSFGFAEIDRKKPDKKGGMTVELHEALRKGEEDGFDLELTVNAKEPWEGVFSFDMSNPNGPKRHRPKAWLKITPP